MEQKVWLHTQFLSHFILIHRNLVISMKGIMSLEPDYKLLLSPEAFYELEESKSYNNNNWLCKL